MQGGEALAVQNDLNKHIYEGNGVARVWPVTFSVLDASHIQVWVTLSGQAPVRVTGNAEITPNQVEYPVTGDPLPVGARLTILREIPLTQLVDWVNQGPFYAETLEAALDKVTMICQQLQEALGRCVRVGVDQQAPPDNSLRLLATAVENAEAAANRAAASATEADVFGRTAGRHEEGARAEADRAEAASWAVFSVRKELRYCGEWAYGVYRPWNIVTFLGSSWILSTGDGAAPPPGGGWALLARRGEDALSFGGLDGGAVDTLFPTSADGGTP